MGADESYERIADGISDGRSLDPLEPGDADGLEAEVVQNLMALSKIRQFHRLPDPTRVGDGGAPSWGPLRLLEPLGAGGFGDVHRAWDVELHRMVAVKFLRDPVGPTGARAEGRRLARIDHPNVVRVYGLATHDERSGLVMELVEGRTLRERVRANGPASAEDVRRIGLALCDALAAIHGAGVVHGDVKAANVIEAESGRIVLMDFGAGSAVDRPDGDRVTAGTPASMAPELLDGGEASPRSDLYALGVLLHFVATGAFPYEGASVDDLRAAHKSGARRSLRELRADLPAGLANAIDAALSLAPNDRPASATALAASMGRAAPETPEPTGGAPGARGARRRLLAVAGAAVAVIVLGAIAALRGFHDLSPPLVHDARLLRGDSRFDPLTSGDRVQVGDLVHLELDVARDCWLYVLNRDERGSAALLFPLPGYELQNPIAPGRNVSIPGKRTSDAQPVAWTIGTAGGREHFLVVASETPIEGFERQALRLPPPERSAGALAQSLDGVDAEELYRGVTGVATIRPDVAVGESPAAQVFETALDLARQLPNAVWVREFVLENQE